MFCYGGWFGLLESGIYNFFWIFDFGWVGMYGYMNVWGFNCNVVIMLIKVGLSGLDISCFKVNFGFLFGIIYVVDYFYDLNSGNIIGMVLMLGGNVVVNIMDVMCVSVIGCSGMFIFWVGNLDECVYGYFEVLLFGWDYLDFCIEVSF